LLLSVFSVFSVVQAFFSLLRPALTAPRR